LLSGLVWLAAAPTLDGDVARAREEDHLTIG